MVLVALGVANEWLEFCEMDAYVVHTRNHAIVSSKCLCDSDWSVWLTMPFLIFDVIGCHLFMYLIAGLMDCFCYVIVDVNLI